ncbi:MAG: hypothetical protein IJP49_09085 [Bacteroidales bacterium]|nr:hypothetical protein [Bacteroidales bacterium]
MRKFVLAVFCLVGLLSCMSDDSTIDESSIVITRGNIRDVYVEAYVDANAKGLEGIDLILPDRSTGYYKTHDRGYSMIYEVYDPQGKLVEKRIQDLGKYGAPSSFSRQGLTIPQPQWWSEDNPVYYKLILRLKIINHTLSTASREFRLVKDSTDTTP